MADGRKFIQTQKFYLAGGGISATDTSMILRSMKYPDNSTNVTMTDIGTVGYGTIEPGTSREEIISFTGVTQNADGTASITGITRGLKFYSPYDQDTNLRKSHAGNAVFIITNNPQFYDGFANKNNDETITGQWLGPTPTDASQLATKQYVDDTVNGGAVSYEAVVIAGTAGETIAANEIVYLKVSDGRWYKTDADDTTTFDKVMLGIAKGSGTSGNPITGGVHIKGVYSGITSGSNGAYCYLSNTAGGVSTSAGTTTFIIGQFKGNTGLHFDPYFYRMLTADQILAIEGTSGTPNTNNKFVTQSSTSQDSTVASNTTVNSTVDFGEAAATTKKNKIAQSFKSNKTKIRGFSVYKKASTGTFIGTVTLALHSDSAGAPGALLQSVTLTNIEWEGYTNDTELTAYFTDETITPGTTYWMVLTTSTSDNANHPVVGSQSVGGYSDGGAYYYNTSDGWVSLGTVDLYFKVHEGILSQLVISRGGTGGIGLNFFNRNFMPVPLYDQKIHLGTSTSPVTAVTSSTDGSKLFVATQTSGNTITITRYARNVYGRYIKTHSATAATNNATNYDGFLSLIGDYIYWGYQVVTTNVFGCRRLLAADLTGVTTMTVPSIASTTGFKGWNDGNFLYACPQGTTTVDKLSISGTTLTSVTTGTLNATPAAVTDYFGSFYDNEFIYLSCQVGTTLTIYKFSDLFGNVLVSTTTITTTDLNIGNSAYNSSANGRGFVFNADNDSVYTLLFDTSDEGDAAGDTYGYFLTPYVKP